MESVNDDSLVMTPETEDVHLIVLEDGARFRVRVKAVDPMIVMKARDAVKVPPRPTYTTKPTASGKSETFPLDEESAKDNPRDKMRWSVYQEDRQNALLQQGLSVMRAWFYYGAELLDELPDMEDWVEEQLALEIEVPSHPNPRIDKKLKQAHFLATKLGMKEREALMSKISRKGGVTEEEIANAEAAFRGEVPAGPEPAG